MNKITTSLVIIVVLLVGGYFLFSKPAPAPITQNKNENMNELESKNPQEAATITSNGIEAENEVKTEVKPEIIKNKEVIYTDSGYLPSNLIIKAGDMVEFKNQSSSGMWTASAMHPSHIVYSGTSLQAHCPDTANVSFDECASAQGGQSWSFTFSKKGTWGYHNHVNASHFGKIIVE